MLLINVVKSFTHTQNSNLAVFCFVGFQKLYIWNKIDNSGGILVLDVDINNKNFALIHSYNPSSEAEQTKTF